MGLHRAARTPRGKAARRALAVTAATGALGTGAALAAPSEASAASVSVWDKVADCESSGHWNIATGNGYYGGLQFTSSTWSAYGGDQYSAEASGATKSQQIAIAEKVLRSQGPGAWPVCSVKAGLTRGGSAPALGTLSAPKVATPKAAVSGSALLAVAYAASKIGAHYRWGGNGPYSFDCSGLTSAAWRSAGVSIPRTANAQWHNLPRVSMSSLRPGDLVAFGYSHSYANHVGIYVGGGYLIDTASRYGGNVGRGKLSTRAGGGSWHVLGAVRPAGSRYTAPKPKAAPKSAPKSGAGTTHLMGPVYVVKPGDWLSKIAAKYKTKGGWRYLYDLNRALVGTNPDLIYPGQKIRLS